MSESGPIHRQTSLVTAALLALCATALGCGGHAKARRYPTAWRSWYQPDPRHIAVRIDLPSEDIAGLGYTLRISQRSGDRIRLDISGRTSPNGPSGTPSDDLVERWLCLLVPLQRAATVRAVSQNLDGRIIRKTPVTGRRNLLTFRFARCSPHDIRRVDYVAR